jgi:hypothetical protein
MMLLKNFKQFGITQFVYKRKRSRGVDGPWLKLNFFTIGAFTKSGRYIKPTKNIKHPYGIIFFL